MNEKQTYFTLAGRTFRIISTWDGWQAFTIDGYLRVKTKKWREDCFLRVRKRPLAGYIDNQLFCERAL